MNKQIVTIQQHSAPDQSVAEFLIRALIANEAQLEITTDKGSSSLIVFYKGAHEIVVNEESGEDGLTVYDGGGGVGDEDRTSLRGAMMQAMLEASEKPNWVPSIGNGFRDKEAFAIWKYLNVRLSLDTAKKITIIVHSPRRNGSIVNREIVIAPDPS